MKRAIVILTLLIFALALWMSHSSSKRLNKKSVLENSKTNVLAARTAPKHSSSKARLESDSTNSVLASYDEGSEWKKLSREQVDAYLLKTKRSPESLLNAFLETGDTNFLAEAVEKYPNNSIVQWTMLNRASPEERSQWLEKFKVTSLDNALPNYLSALDDLKAGKIDKALAEMDAANGKHYNAFERERMQSREEMYLLAGYSALDARTRGMETVPLHNLSEMKALAQEISVLQQKYKVSGDMASAQQLAALGIEASRKLSQPNTPYLINELVGMAMENIALRNLDAGTYYDFLGKTAGERQQELKGQKQEMKDLIPIFSDLYPRLSDTEKMIYSDRLNLYGELDAMKWLKKTYGSEPK